MNTPPFTMLQLAEAFSARLREELGSLLADVIRLNRDEIDPKVCHSHDFCDANEVMLEALRDCLPDQRFDGPDAKIALVHEYAQICDAAWTLARAHHFTL